MGFPVPYQRRPGLDPRSEREKVDELMSHTAQVIEWHEKRGKNEECPDFPNIPLRSNLTPKRRLDTKEEHILVTRFQRIGDLRARNVMILSQKGLLYKIAREEFFNKIHTNQQEDLIQEGYEGLFRAIEKYDQSYGCRFSTYAVFWMRAYMEDFIHNVKRKDEMIVEGTGRYHNSKAVREKMVSLDAQAIVGDDSGMTLEERIADTKNVEADSITISNELSALVQRMAIKVAIEMNNQRVKSIVLKRLLAKEPETLGSLAKEFGVTKERMRQIELQFMKRFKHQMKKRLVEV
jgi:RNA polymerase sigma factor (sigma-70 family)